MLHNNSVHMCILPVQSLTDASKVPQRASKKLQEASQAARSRRQPQQQSPDFYLKNKDKLRLDVIKKELTCDNYKEKFQHLLCWEEKEHERILTKRYTLLTVMAESINSFPPNDTT